MYEDKDITFVADFHGKMKVVKGRIINFEHGVGLTIVEKMFPEHYLFCMKKNNVSNEGCSQYEIDKYNEIFNFIEEVIKNEKVLSIFELSNLFKGLPIHNKKVTAEDCVFNR